MEARPPYAPAKETEAAGLRLIPNARSPSREQVSSRRAGRTFRRGRRVRQGRGSALPPGIRMATSPGGAAWSWPARLAAMFAEASGGAALHQFRHSVLTHEARNSRRVREIVRGSGEEPSATLNPPRKPGDNPLYHPVMVGAQRYPSRS